MHALPAEGLFGLYLGTETRTVGGECDKRSEPISNKLSVGHQVRLSGYYCDQINDSISHTCFGSEAPGWNLKKYNNNNT